MEVCLKVEGVGVYTYVQTVDQSVDVVGYPPVVTDIIALLRRMFRFDPPADAETAVAQLVHALVGARYPTRVDIIPRLQPAARIDIKWCPQGELRFRCS